MPGVHGARLTGAGFGGCVVALTERGALDPGDFPEGAWRVRASRPRASSTSDRKVPRQAWIPDLRTQSWRTDSSRIYSSRIYGSRIYSSRIYSSRSNSSFFAWNSASERIPRWRRSSNCTSRSATVGPAGACGGGGGIGADPG